MSFHFLDIALTSSFILHKNVCAKTKCHVVLLRISADLHGVLLDNTPAERKYGHSCGHCRGVYTFRQGTCRPQEVQTSWQCKCQTPCVTYSIQIAKFQSLGPLDHRIFFYWVVENFDCKNEDAQKSIFCK